MTSARSSSTARTQNLPDKPYIASKKPPVPLATLCSFGDEPDKHFLKKCNSQEENLQRAADRFMASKFAQKGVLALVCLTVSVGEAMAASKGAAGFTKATQEVSSYQTPVSNLMKAIAAVIALVGAFNVYFKMQ